MRYVERERMMAAVGMAFGLGMGLGIAMGMLMAPESGDRLRKTLGKRASHWGDRLTEGVGDGYDWAKGSLQRAIRG